MQAQIVMELPRVYYILLKPQISRLIVSEVSRNMGSILSNRETGEVWLAKLVWKWATDWSSTHWSVPGQTNTYHTVEVQCHVHVHTLMQQIVYIMAYFCVIHPRSLAVPPCTCTCSIIDWIRQTLTCLPDSMHQPSPFLGIKIPAQYCALIDNFIKYDSY